MGSLSQKHGRSNEFPKPRRSIDHSDTTKQNPIKGFLRDNPKHLKRDPLKSTKKPSGTYSRPSTFDPYNAERRSTFGEYSANGGNTSSQLKFVPKPRKYEDDNKYVEQALAIIQFTLQEANDLEQVIRMSNKLSSDSVYVREVMSRFLVQLEKIETVNNRKILEKKNEGLLLIQAKIVELVRQSEDIKRTAHRDSLNTYTHKREDQNHSKSVASKCSNSERVAGKTRHGSNKRLNLTPIAEDLEKDEISDGRTSEIIEATWSKGSLTVYDSVLNFSSGELELCDSPVEENHSVENVEMSSSSSLALDSDQSSLSLQENLFSSYSALNSDQNTLFSCSSFASDPDQHTSAVQKTQEPPCSPFVFNPDKKTPSLRKLQTPPCSPIVSYPDKKTLGVQKLRGPLRSSPVLHPDKKISSGRKLQAPLFYSSVKNISGVQKMQGPPCCSLVSDLNQKTLGVQKLRGPLRSPVVLNPDKKVSGGQKSSVKNISAVRKMQEPPCYSLVSNTDQKTLGVQKLQGPRRSSFVLEHDKNISSIREMQEQPCSYSISDSYQTTSSVQKLQESDKKISSGQKLQGRLVSSSVKNISAVQKMQGSPCSSLVSDLDQKTLGVQKPQGPLRSSFVLEPDKNISSVQEMQERPCSYCITDSDQKTSSAQNLQGPPPSSFVLNSDQKAPIVQKLQGSPCSFSVSDSDKTCVQKLQRSPDSSSYVLDPDRNVSSVQEMRECKNVDSGQRNLNFKRVVGPYIIINQDFHKSTVTSTNTIIQETLEENLNHATCMSSKDEVTITEETTRIRRNVHKVNIESSARGRYELLPGMTSQMRLLLILLLSLLIEIPILMIICPLWK